MDNFNFKRFGAYLKSDMVNFRSRFGVSSLVMIAMPLLCYLLNGLFNLVFSGYWASQNFNGRLVIFFITYTCFSLVAPTKTYGYVTEKRAGSAFILLPASILEKVLSMILICCIFAPICFLVCYGLLDWAICTFDSACGTPLFLADYLDRFRIMMPFADGNVLFVADDWIQFILVFLLGAIWFRKNKVAKTILVSFAVTFVLVLTSAPVVHSIFGEYSINSDNIHLFADKFHWMFDHMILLDTINDTLVNLALSVAIYFRIKTIKF